MFVYVCVDTCVYVRVFAHVSMHMWRPEEKLRGYYSPSDNTYLIYLRQSLTALELPPQYWNYKLESGFLRHVVKINIVFMLVL